MTEEQVFLAALELPDETERGTYLDETCGANAGLRQQVEALLAAHFKSGEFMDVPAAEQAIGGSSLSHAVTIQSDHMPAHQNLDDESDALEFLAPPTREGSLGRIGHYEVLQVLGKGGFGIVFRAFDDVLQRVVAIKVMAPQMAATSPARKRFLREARTSAQVRHENVVQVYEVGEQPLPYLVMEFIPGETLQQKLDRNGPLDVGETLRIGRQIAEGLAAAHGMDLIHRDIKPGNVLLEGGQHKVKITDFGLARAADDASMTQSGQIAGTPMYMAPEQALGETLDQRADLFSLGSVLYQMVAGRPPFRANTAVAVLKRVVDDTPRNIREVIPETPQWLCDIIAKLHAKSPDDRYQSAREVADVLADCEAQLKQSSRLRDFSRIPREKPQRSPHRRSLAVATAICMLLALALASPFLYRYVTNQSACNLIYSGAIDPNLDNILIKRDGQVVAKLITSHGIVHLPAGDYEAEVVCKEGYELAKYRRGPFSVLGELPGALGWEDAVGRTFPLTLTRDWDVSISLKLAKLTADPSNAPRDELGWVQLFNGKDLTGWKMHPEQPGTWEVKDGILTGSQRPGDLYGERGDFANFHLRVQAKVNLGGDSGVFFRAGTDARLGQGYEAEIHKNRYARKTGTITTIRANGPPLVLGHVADDSLTRPDEWFELEIIAQQGHFITKINGQETANCSDPANLHAAGHLGLQVWSPNTLVQFRKIEIKELPASPPPTTSFVSLFNGTDLTGWKTHPERPGQWKVERGALVGSAVPSYLFSDGTYGNFHLRLEAKINQGGDSSVFLRAPFSLREGRTAAQARPAAGYDVELQQDPAYVAKTGSVGDAETAGPPRMLWQNEQASLTSADEWFTLEIIADGNRIISKVNGTQTADCRDPRSRYDAGHLALQVYSPQTIVQFRKIEIKELPASPPASDGFVSLFNGKDLTGWKYQSKHPGDWTVNQGVLTSGGEGNYLYTERGDFRDFHLRAEVLLDRGYSGILLRTPFGSLWNDSAGQPGLEGYCVFVTEPSHPFPTGTLRVDETRNELAPVGMTEPGKWCVLEVIVQGNQIRSFIDGKSAASYVDAKNAYDKGHIALQHLHPNIGIKFRKIEIKELPASAPPLPPTFTNSIGMEFVLVPKGKSWLGGGQEKLGDKEVEIPADYYLGKYEVTQDEWEKVMGENPSWFSRTGRGADAVKDIGDADLKRFPVESVSWDQCQIFVAKLSRLEKATGWVYRLPTEVEWEYACRGGPMLDKADSAFDFYFAKPTNTLLPEQANFNSGTYENLVGLKRTCKVGSYPTNVLGLYDMHGNVWEWCEEAFTTGDGTSKRVNRSGSWFSYSGDSTATFRDKVPASDGYYALGLRLVRVPSGAASTEAKTPPLVAPFTDADVQRIAALPAAEQVEEVRKELMRLNPGFGGKVTPTIENGAVMEFSVNTDEILNVAPVRAFTKLVYLDLRGTYPNKGKLSDLSPLKGMTISRLDCSSTQVADLSPLADLPLTFLAVNHNPVVDLSPLKKMPLESLGIAETKVSDLSPLKGMQIRTLGAQLLPVKDLSPLEGLPLTGLDLYHTIGVTSLEPLRGMPLDNLNLQDVPVSDLSPLAGMSTLRTLVLQATKVSDLSPLADLKLTDLLLHGKEITDLSPLKGLPLTRLTIDGTGVNDLRPLQGMPLLEFRLTPQNITQGLDILKGIQSLRTIGIDGNRAWPPAEFWERLDKGEFQ